MRINDVIIKPVVTEKALSGTAHNVYVFKVNKDATKNQVRSVVEKLFNVEISRIASITTKGKTRRVGRKLRTKQLPDVKKMYITLKKGKIDIMPSSV